MSVVSAAAEAAIQPLLALLNSGGGGLLRRTTYATTTHASYVAWRDSLDAPGSIGNLYGDLDENSGQGGSGAVNVALASRLAPRAVVRSDAARANAVAELSGLTAEGAVDILLVVGGKVWTADHPSGAETSIHPAWRDAVMQVGLRAAWAPAAGAGFPQRREAVFQGLSRRADALRRAFPGSGAYLNEARARQSLAPLFEDDTLPSPAALSSQ